MPAVFGDFLAAAAEHLEAAVVVSDGQVTQLPEIVRELHHLVAVMSHCLDDLTRMTRSRCPAELTCMPGSAWSSTPTRPFIRPRTTSARSRNNPVAMRTRRHRGGRAIWPVPRRS